MTLARLIATGSGRLAARIEIEGCSIQFVSDPGMERTLSDGRRLVHCFDLFGEAAMGFKIDERVNLPEALLEQTGTTLTLTETQDEDLAAALFFKPEVERYITSKVSSSATSISMLSTSGITAGDVVHVGTEAILVNKVTNATTLDVTGGRAYWGTIAQAHWTRGDDEGLTYAVMTDRPLRTRGRRVRLYLYGDGDSLQGDGGNSGDPVWRGFTRSEPRFTEAGTKVQISVGGLTELLDSKLGGDLGEPVVPRGIYYSWESGLHVGVYEIGGASGNETAFPASVFTGHYETQEAFVAAFKTWLDAIIATTNVDSTLVPVVRPDGTWTIEVYAAATVTSLHVTVGSLCDGRVASSTYDGSSTDTATLVDANGDVVTDVSNATEPMRLNWEIGPEGARTVPRGWFGPGDIEGWDRDRFTDATQAATYPSKRIYTSRAVNSGWSSMAIEWGNGISATHGVDAVNTGSDSIDLARAFGFEGPGQPTQFQAYTSRLLPTISPSRTLTAGSLGDFRDALVAEAIEYANRGTSPFVTSSDLADWTDVAAASESATWLAQRSWSFTTPAELTDVLSAELRMRGLFPITDSTGKIAIAPLVVPTTTDSVYTIDEEIYSEGWASAERGNQTVNRWLLRTGYDSREDDWTGRPISAVNVSALAQDHQDRPLTIEPRSTTPDDPDYNAVALAALPALGLFGWPHDFITINVSWKLFNVRLGDVVTFSADHLPDYSLGRRPMDSVLGTVVARTWELGKPFGTLTIMVSWQNVAGYSPTARITAQADLGGDVWRVTVSPTLYAPTDLAGDVTSTPAALFDVDDRVRVVELDATSATTVLGTITVVDTSTNLITVSFDGTWTPGSDTWDLIFAPADDGSLAASQKLFCAISDATGFYDGDDPARTYGPGAIGPESVAGELAHYVRFDPSLIGGNDFADAGMCRRALSNLSHLADQVAQVRVNWQHYTAFGNDYVTVYEASPTVDEYYEMWRSPIFDMHVMPDGSSYRMRTRVTVATSNATATASFRVALVPAGSTALAEVYEAGVNVSSIMTTASTTYADKEPTSLIYLTAERVARARQTVACINSVGGAEVTGERLAVRLVVFGAINNASYEARLRGVYGAEYYPQTLAAMLQAGGVQGSKPVNSAHWVHAAQLHNQLVSRPACVVPAHMCGTVEQETTSNFYLLFKKRYADLRYQVRIALQQSDSGTAQNQSVDVTFPVSGTTYPLDRPARTAAPREYLFEVDVASQSLGEQEVSFSVLGAESTPGDTRVWVSVESVPRTALVDDGSDVGVERLDFWPREPITDDDLGDLLDRQDEALAASRRVGMFAMAFGSAAPPSFNSGTWTAALDDAVNMLGRFLYEGETTRTLSWKVRAICSDGTTAGTIRVSNTSGGTAIGSITIPAGTTSATWLPATADTFTVDCEDNTEADGLPSSTWDEHTFEVQRTAGAGTIKIESICVWEA